jgi:hypothetical protein
MFSRIGTKMIGSGILGFLALMEYEKRKNNTKQLETIRKSGKSEGKNLDHAAENIDKQTFNKPEASTPCSKLMQLFILGRVDIQFSQAEGSKTYYSLPGAMYFAKMQQCNDDVSSKRCTAVFTSYEEHDSLYYGDGIGTVIKTTLEFKDNDSEFKGTNSFLIKNAIFKEVVETDFLDTEKNTGEASIIIQGHTK